MDEKKSKDLRSRIQELEVENRELNAKVWLLQKDVDTLGPENVRLLNAYHAARAEIARLKAPKVRGAPRKNIAGSYEEYLFREANELIVKSLRPGGEKLSKRRAAIQADKLIRMTAKTLQENGMPGAFSGLASQYPKTEDAIYSAYRRAAKKCAP